MEQEYHFSKHLFLRTPYYSFARYDIERVPEVLDDPAFRDALWLASPGLYRQLQLKAFDFSRLLDKEKHTVYKYYNRMCFRPTPFGGFAAFTTLEWGAGVSVQLHPDQETRLHLAPDQAFIAEINKLTSGAAGEEMHTLNPTLYLLGKEYRFIKSTPGDKGQTSYTLDVLEAEPFYKKLFSLFKKQGLTYGKLQEWIIDELQCTIEEADSYIHFLLEEQLLYPKAKGRIIYAGPESDLWFNDPKQDRLWRTIVSSAARNPGSVAALAERISTVFPTTEAEVAQPFYASVERPLKSGGPGKDDREELEKAIRVLQQISLPAPQSALNNFITAFEAKFDLAKVPLLKAVDPDAGIAYDSLITSPDPNSVLKDLRFPAPAAGQRANDWTDIHKLLFGLWRGGNREQHAPLHLPAGELPMPPGGAGSVNFPPTIAVMYRKTEDHLFVEHAGGVTGTSLIGRFSVFSDQVLQMARELALMDAKSNPGVIFADIALLTESHTDNINRRKQIYPYQIPVNVDASMDASCLRPEDLHLSVAGGELLLESKSTGKRVIPRLATAYNYRHTNLPLFRLLCDLQYQGIAAHISFDLERFFPGLDFYPRVCIGRVVLSCTTWKFGERELKTLTDPINGDMMTALRSFRAQYGLPQRISLGNGDQQLVFDLGNEQEALFFLKCIAGSTHVRLQEYLLPDRSVKTGNRPLAAQYVAFLSHDQPVYAPTNGHLPHKAFENGREFRLGSEWLYLKIYCTPESSDFILAHVLYDFVSKNSKYIRNWFFIRYHDPDYHIRLRLQISEDHLSQLLTKLRELLDKDNCRHLIKAVLGDTYRRELERYGPEMIEQAEQHFGASSSFALALIRAIRTATTSVTEFEAGFLTTYYLLTNYFPDLQAANVFTGQLAETFLVEFKADKSLRTGMDARYRSLKTKLARLVDMSLGDALEPSLYSTFQVVMRQTRATGLLMDGHHHAGVHKLIADLLHMHLNRIFRTAQRQQEMLVYFCLHEYGKSTIARERKLRKDQ